VTADAYTRGFRLRLPHGQVLDGAEFPNGRVIVMDDPEWGLCSGARNADLLTVCYPGSRIEWPDGQNSAADATPERPTRPCTPTIADWAGEQQGAAVSGGDVAGAGLPPEQPCTDPRHTGAIREQLGCTGPDPATT
jgi:hypothetical protein